MPFALALQPISPVQNVGYLTNRRLLVVDDNATNRKVVRHQATRWGIQVDEVDSAANALIALRSACEQNLLYDIALIDMQMPLVDGMTLGTQIKADSALARLPLILLTSTNQRDEVQRALEIGFAAYLIKPVKPSRLLDTIMNILGTSTGPEEGEKRAGGESKLKLIPQRQFSRADGSCYNGDVTTLNAGEPGRGLLHLGSQRRGGEPRPLEATGVKPKLRLLLAEDNLVNQKVALKQLQTLGYTADVATNGKEVLQLLEKIPYDLILMDCQMPVLDGLEATREIHRWQDCDFANGHRPVVVAMTANAMKEDQQKCRAAGMDDYLSKPVFKDKLAAVLEHWSSVIMTREEMI